MIQQLRIYEIFENNKAAFHARFRDHAARIMRTRYGFQIVAMWETKFGEKTEFVYLLGWPDEATKTAAWSAFMADTEWSEIKRVTHAEHGHGGPDRGPFAYACGLFAGKGTEPFAVATRLCIATKSRDVAKGRLIGLP
jgi:hypothetical protein